MPTYNREALLPRSIQSVIAQTLPSWELIVIDDGSSDSTAEVVRQLQASDPRIHYIYQENQGAAAARNRGIALSRAKYLAFLDSDDFLLPRHLEYRARMWQLDQSIDLIHGRPQIIGDQYVVDRGCSRELVSLNDPNIRIGGTFTLNKGTMIAIGGFPLMRYAEDSSLYDLFVAFGHQIVECRRKTYCYDRTGDDSITLKVREESERRSAAVRAIFAR